ncbi:type II secretion system F family protein [Candidatus Saccharibacteria bacterium]|nr:type II secretion system F family protein [Candidatus Saccharibacteria bacterium]MBI3338211.1 type II secretion system F family protein [Candidatus Saccharibacteria bacterium]
MTGYIEADSVALATQALSRRGLKTVKIQQSKEGSFLNKLPLSKKNKKIKLKDLVVFTRQLSTMINAGVPLVRSLATLQAQTENANFQRHISEITREIEGGTSFADALEKHSQVFSPIYINMVRAGEAGGILDEILRRLAEQQEKDAKIRGKFKSAMTYPIILLVITFSVFMGLMVLAMPRIGKIIKDLAGDQAKLPTITTVMLGISNFMVKQWYVILGVSFVGSFLIRRYIKTPKGRRRKDELIMKVPVLKVIILKVAIARFARIFASLMAAGVTVVESIEITAKAIGNAVIEDELYAAAKEVTNGQPFSVPLSNSKIFPPIVSQMMAIGEETGKTDEILVKVADFYEEEVDNAVESLSSILEPIMIVIMGGLVGLIAISVMGPISNLSSQI